MTIVEAGRTVIGGVDTHLDVHVAAALDPIGGVLGVESFDATPQGYKAMFEWMGAFGTVSKVGVEGTGSDPSMARSRRDRRSNCHATRELVGLIGSAPDRRSEASETTILANVQRAARASQMRRCTHG